MSDINIFRLSGDTVTELECHSAAIIKSPDDLEQAKPFIVKSYEAS
ncbi:MAG: hypothetical protein HYV06_00825 [Deltaproteobacteria bacterium]|nr:hypothetical protein [Deltaproteobacteria bacterium]